MKRSLGDYLLDLRKWCADHKRLPYKADDSRENIYGDEDEHAHDTDELCGNPLGGIESVQVTP